MSSTVTASVVDSVHEADAIYYKDATELAALIRTKELSPRKSSSAPRPYQARSIRRLTPS